MNEDQISDLITHLEKVKDENEKMTLVAAKAYADRSGKPVLEILNLMKEEKWLTADEAKEWVFFLVKGANPLEEGFILLFSGPSIPRGCI